MVMQNFWGVKEVYYGIVQVVNYLSNLALQSAEKSRMCRSIVGDVLSNEHVRLTSRGRFL